jgi:serine protease AprX
VSGLRLRAGRAREEDSALRHDHARLSGTRASALWGRGSERLCVVLVAALALAAPAGAAAGGGAEQSGAFVPKALLDAARSRGDATFDVIVQGAGTGSDGVAAALAAERGKGRGKAKGVTKHLRATNAQVAAITEDAPMVPTAFSNDADWPSVSGLSSLWNSFGSWCGSASTMPAIAVVDSGIDASRSDFGGRVVAQATFVSAGANAAGDGRGHGTFVASIAAGEAAGHAGGAPIAKLVSVDVVNDAGVALTSDVIAGIDWLIQNKDAYGIRVANFSLHSARRSTFMFDPLNKAVEKLWLSGVVVVAAAGNYAVSGQASGVLHSPGNDPFVITVGAVDLNGTRSVTNDYPAPWSAFGYTLDGFAKPDLLAPGRYMIGAIPAGSTMALDRPDRIVTPGYMRLSGTSFAAPVVSAAAADVLAAHPAWTPDQVKGALLATAKKLGRIDPLSAGAGEVNAYTAAQTTSAPNPNLALAKFVVPDPEGGSLFDAAAWAAAAQADPNWDAANWTDANWTDANWTSANWTDANWTSANWTDANWTDANWTDANWTALNWID